MSGQRFCFVSEQDRLLINACSEYEKSQSSQINLGGILEGASVQNVNCQHYL